MIVATAGHIDHGKTVLVKALSGVDTDRLPEEKARGVSIELGFAYVPLSESLVLGFIDVPGHERFIRNMLAGVTGIDYALLVVAADDGPMPQTREHLAILDLMGVAEGAVALTKIDRVDRDRVAEVATEIEAMLAGTSLAGAPVFPVSGHTGDGVPALRERLVAAAEESVGRIPQGCFRLAVDRVFTLQGTGLVVTGTVFAGSVRTGDRLMLSPAGVEVRVRSVHEQNRAAEIGRKGERCAINITGADLRNVPVHRGDWLLDPAIHCPSDRIDARLRVLPGEERALAHWTPVHVHLGAATTTGRVAVLEGPSIAPGETGLVQLVLDQRIGGLHGDRLVVRDQSAQRTLGGGRVVDVFPPRRGRAKPDRLAFLRAMEPSDHVEALNGLLASSANGVALDRFLRCRNIAQAEAEALWPKVPMVKVGRPEAPLGMQPESLEALRQSVSRALVEEHAARPQVPTVDEAVLRRRTQIARPLFDAALLALLQSGEVVREGTGVRARSHRAAMSEADMTLWAEVAPFLETGLEEGNLRPPRLLEVAEELEIEPRRLEQFLIRAARIGLVHKVADNRYFTPATLAALGRLAEELAAAAPNAQFDVKDYRDRSGLGRNVAIEILEYFDKQGFTRRTDKGRRVLKPVDEAFGS